MSATEHAGDAQAARARRSRALPEGPVEWTCKVASEVALVVLLVLIAVDTVKPYWDDWAKSRGPDVVDALGKIRATLGR